MTSSRQVLVALCLATLCGCAAPPPRPAVIERLTPEQLAQLKPTPNPAIPLDEIVMWSREGAKPEAIIRRLTETGTVHLLTPAQIVDLSRQGVDQAVIDHLAAGAEKARQATLATQLADRDAREADRLARERARRMAAERDWAWSWSFGYGSWGPAWGLGWGRPYPYGPYYPWRRW